MPTMTENEAKAADADRSSESWDALAAWTEAARNFHTAIEPVRRLNHPPCDPDRCQHRTRAAALAAQALNWMDRGEPAHARDLLRQIAGGDA